MLLPFISEYRHRSALTTKRKAPPPAPPPGPINILCVTLGDTPESGQCVWYFDEDVTVTGPPTGLRVQVEGEWIEPTGFVQNGPREVLVSYQTPQYLDDCAYSVIAPPANISEAARIVLPAEGTITLE